MSGGQRHLMADVKRFNITTSPDVVQQYQWELAAIIAGQHTQLHGSEHYRAQAEERELPHTVLLHSLTPNCLVEVQILRDQPWRFVLRLVGYGKPGSMGDELDLTIVIGMNGLMQSGWWNRPGHAPLGPVGRIAYHEEGELE